MAFNNATPTMMYNYQTLAPKPIQRPAHDPKILKSLNLLIFLHKIPTFLDDDDVLHVLAGCGSVASWNRVCSGNGRMHHYGFCVFEKEISVVRALRSLATPVYLEDTKENINSMQVMIDISTKNNLRKKFKNDLLVKEADYEVLQRLQYIFEPFVTMEKHEFESLLEAGKPPPSGELVAHQELLFDQEEAEIPQVTQDQTLERSFFNRKQRFEHQITTKSSTQAKNEQILLHRKNLKAQKFKELYDFYNNFDDDLIRKQGGTLFFDDAARWWRTRQPSRQKELEMDLKMRGEDEAKKAKNEELKRIKRQQEKLKEAASFLNNLEFNDVQEEAEEEDVLPIMTAEARALKIQQVVASIPSKTDELFTFQVQWKYLNKNVIESRFKPWLLKKLQPTLGKDCLILIKFILNLVEAHPPNCIDLIIEELKKVLEEETESFVGMFWRLVIFECEARAMGLA